MEIVLVGAGNLATQIGKAFMQAHHRIKQVYSRTEASASNLARQLESTYTNCIDNILPDADVYIYALKDDVVIDVMTRVKAPNALHLHTAGSVPMHTQTGGRYGVLYPLQTFSKERPVDFRCIPLFIEGDTDETLQAIRTLAESISPQVYNASSAQRQQLHLAAVFACNFVNCLYANASELLRDVGIPFKALLPLIDETAGKIHLLTPKEAQTGPAKRYDQNIMQQHLSKLTSSTQQSIYRLLSEDIYHRHMTQDTEKR